MTTQLDQISEAIGQLRGTQAATNIAVEQLERRFDASLELLRRDINKVFEDIRTRHHEHNNEVMKQLGRMDLDMVTRFKDHETRISTMENWIATFTGIQKANRTWLATISALIGGIAGGIVEFFARRFG